MHYVSYIRHYIYIHCYTTYPEILEQYTPGINPLLFFTFAKIMPSLNYRVLFISCFRPLRVQYDITDLAGKLCVLMNFAL